jgi:glyoxylase-like metal-dependent hydrolase (beta-lactamase superfamily II)
MTDTTSPRDDLSGGEGDTGDSPRVNPAWFAHEVCAEGITRIWEPQVGELLQSNMFLVRDGDEQLLVDTGLGVTALRQSLPQLLERPTTLFLTHSHRDHVGGAHEFDQRLAQRWESDQLIAGLRGSLLRADMAPEYVTLLEGVGYPVPECLLHEVPAWCDVTAHVIPAAPATTLVQEGDTISVGARRFAALLVPGHTPGSLALFEESTGLLLAGDLLYDGPLIDFLPDCDPVSYRESMARVLELPLTMVCGGHEPPMSAQRAMEVGQAYLAQSRPS